jgi:hypothetical protein
MSFFSDDFSRLGKDVLTLARQVAKTFAAQEATTNVADATTFESTTGFVDATTTEKFRKSKLRKNGYYIPTFAGTYASPSPYWISRSSP